MVSHSQHAATMETQTISQLPQHSHSHYVLQVHPVTGAHKATLVVFGTWAPVTGRGWVVHQARWALQREGLTDA
jgi:hypothetical protein